MVNLNAERGGNINNRKRKTRKCKSRRIKTKRVKITKKSATRSFNRKGTKKLRKKRKMKGGDEGDDAEDAKANIKGVFKARFIKQLYKNVLTLCDENTEHLNNDIDVTDGDVDKYIAENEWGYSLMSIRLPNNNKNIIKKYLIAKANLNAYTEDRNWQDTGTSDTGTSDTGTSNTNCATLNSGKNIDNLPEKKKETYSKQKGSLTIINRVRTGPILQKLQLEAVNELFNINTDIMPTSEELQKVYPSFISDGKTVSREPPIKYDKDCSCWMKEGENVAKIMKKKPSTPTELLKFCITRINTIFGKNIALLDTSDDFASIYNNYVTQIIKLYEKNNIKYKESEIWWRERVYKECEKVYNELKGILDTKKSISNSLNQRRDNFDPPEEWISRYR